MTGLKYKCLQCHCWKVVRGHSLHNIQCLQTILGDPRLLSQLIVNGRVEGMLGHEAPHGCARSIPFTMVVVPRNTKEGILLGHPCAY
eukprot:g28347.t1